VDLVSQQEKRPWQKGGGFTTLHDFTTAHS
jgi:hypothetical protein